MKRLRPGQEPFKVPPAFLIPGDPMRLLKLSLALAAALPLAAMAQATIAPGVTYVPPGGAYNQLPGGAVSVAPGFVPGAVPALPGMTPGMPGNVPGMMPQQPQQPQQDTQANRPSVERRATPTAAEQGFGSQLDLERMQRELEEQAAMSSPRQKGIQVPVPRLGNPVARDPSHREWLANWEWALGRLGVSAAKVQFEANRLSKDDFEAWGSRQLRFRHGEQARLDVMDRARLQAAP